MDDRWQGLARRELLARRDRSGAWGYRRDGVPGIEPTALSVLGLIASGDSGSSADDLRTSREAANWMADIQREDGSLPACANPAMPGWATPYAILLWGVLGGYEVQRGRACRWLLGLEGRVSGNSVEGRAVLGHDPTLIGWPWVAETNSWVEPTALAILALHREGLGDHPRVGRGVSMIVDPRSRAAAGITAIRSFSGRGFALNRDPPASRCWPWPLSENPRRSSRPRSST